MTQLSEMKRSSQVSACAHGLIVAALFASHATAQDADPLVQLINEYRSSRQTCDGKRTAAAGPLAPEERLARADVGSSSGSLQEALQRVGYTAARVQFVVLTGPDNARSAMAALKNGYCAVLTNPSFSDIGVSRRDSRWQIVFAHPLLSPDLGDWREAGKAVLSLVNSARAQPRTCGERRFTRAPPVEWNAKLGSTALAHSRDMAKRNYFAHAGKGGSTVGDRVARQKYKWRRIGENIATGQGSPRQVVAGWLASPHHCMNIMEGAFTEMGAAYAVNPASATKIYWTQVFGTPRR